MPVNRFGRVLRPIPSVFQLDIPADASPRDRVIKMVDVGTAIRRPTLQWCSRDKLKALDASATPAEVEAVLTDPENGWRPMHSVESLIDQFYPFRNRHDRLVSRTMHVGIIVQGDFKKLRAHIEQLLDERVGDFDLANLRTLANWMNAPGNHPNPRGFFTRRQILSKLPHAFVDQDIPNLRQADSGDQ